MGYWKAEKFKKFTFPASEYILDGVLPDEHYNVWQLIVHITELVYGSGRNGLATGKIVRVMQFSINLQISTFKSLSV